MVQGMCFSIAMVLLLYGTAPRQVESSSSEVHLKLLGDLLDNYTKPFMRPVNETTKTVDVGIRFSPIFSSLDETQEELKTRGMLALKWTDYRLRWDPTDYDGINETNIPLLFNEKQRVWIPEVYLYECLVTDFKSLFTETIGVTLIYTGEVHWYTLANTRTYCTVENGKFPFDVQTCPLTFTTWLYQSNEQTFYTIDDLVKNDTYKKYEMSNALWTSKINDVKVEMISYDCESCNGEKQSYVRYELMLTRGQSGLLVLIFVSPCIVVAILTTCVICLPHVDAPAYALTCVLTFFVYLMFLYSRLPPTGGAYIGIFMILMILGGVLAVFYAVFSKHDCHPCVKCGARDRERHGSTNYGATEDGQSINEEHETENVGQEEVTTHNKEGARAKETLTRSKDTDSAEDFSKSCCCRCCRRRCRRCYRCCCCFRYCRHCRCCPSVGLCDVYSGPPGKSNNGL
ncbi:Neuronal acetylcholine receptor subunit alpha-10 [Holothuria leucospilota]|uniref:Neuronal acetylcholine receptor subunit alpha-10 n=1 Tax=Holothuria leucospilota TaxID=206669 RepID=A0A9Q1CM01_HOLLE|nr:Neuronal acetylcholine receptor subunit alpha-10 [Holothuria leucospilota]